MLRTTTGLLASVAAFAWPLSASAQDDELWAQIARSLKAHGGKELVKKYPAAQVKYQGDVDAQGMAAKVKGEVHTAPQRMKNVIDVEVNGMNIKVQQGFDGKALWMDVMGMSQEFKDDDKIKEIQESMHAEQVGNLADLDRKNYQLSGLGDMKIKGKDALGVRVSREGKRDVILWFDKQSHLLLKHEVRGRDPFGQQGEVNNEKYYSDYKAVMGIQTPGRLEVHADGKKVMELEITDFRYHERLDDGTFARP